MNAQKIICDIPVDGTEVWTDTAYQPVNRIHKTKPFEVWFIQTTHGNLLAADEHILFRPNNEEVHVKDLVAGDLIRSQYGKATVKKVKRLGAEVVMYDLEVGSPDHRYFTNGLLSHNTVTSLIYIAWCLLFKPDFNVFLLGNKLNTAIELMNKLNDILENVPFFMKQGILIKNVKNMKFENGSTVRADATTKNAIRGYTVHLLYLDEFAFVPGNIQEEFYRAAYATISSSQKAQIIITSTPNGQNLFYKIYNDAVNGENYYHPIRIDYWQVPGRDELWKETTLRNLNGDIRAFEQEYNNSFLVSGDSLLKETTTTIMRKLEREFVSYKMPAFDREPVVPVDFNYSDLKFHPNFNPADFEELNAMGYRKNMFVLSIDLSSGVGKDYSVINIFKLTPMSVKNINRNKFFRNITDFFTLLQIGIFRSNTMQIEEVALVTYILCTRVMDASNCRLVVEQNHRFHDFVLWLTGFEGGNNQFDPDVIFKYHRRKEDEQKHVRPVPGLLLKSDNRSTFLNKLPQIMDDGKIIITESVTSQELQKFVKVSEAGKGTKIIAADAKNDDAAMTVANLTSIYETYDFPAMCEELMSYQDPEFVELVEAKLNGVQEQQY